jgi:hypothetical protein
MNKNPISASSIRPKTLINFILMKYIFLIAAFNALLFVVLILQKKKALHDKVLIFC